MEKSLFNGRIVVIADFEAYEKPLPDSLTGNPQYYNNPAYEWIGNFGLRTSGATTKDYEILVDEEANKTLVFWNGTRPVPIPRGPNRQRNKRKYASGKLNLVDPPIGWAT